MANPFTLRHLFVLLIMVIMFQGCRKEDKPGIPELTTNPVIIVSTMTAQSGGNITNDEGHEVFSRGVCFAMKKNPTTSDFKVNAGTGKGSFTVTFDLSKLVIGAVCYVRAFATNSEGTAYGNELSIVIPDPDFKIGQSYKGGTIAYIDTTKLHGFIAADLSGASGTWGCQGSQVTGASGTAIGTGNQNTIDIVNSCSENTAASYCASLVSGGFDDWYLPSKDELNQLYINRDIIGGFTDDIYWSSSENNNSNAWSHNFSTGIQDLYYKSHPAHVRPIRSF